MFQSDPVPVGDVPNRRGNSPAGPLQLRKGLLDRIEKRKQSFVQTAGKRYRLYLGRLLTNAGAPIGEADPAQLRMAESGFQDLVAQRLDRHYIARLAEVAPAVVAEAANDPMFGLMPGPRSETIADGFLETLGNAFSAHASRTVGEMTSLPPEGMRGCLLAFQEDMTVRVRRLNMDVVEIYCLAYQEATLDADREHGD